MNADLPLRDVGLSHRLLLPVLGIPVTFATNAAAVLEMVEAAFGAWRNLDPASAAGADTVQIRLVVGAGDEGADDHAPFRYHMPDEDRVLITSPGSFGITDPVHRSAVARVTSDLLADAEHFRYGFLEALTLALLTHLDRQPLHAAALVRDGTAVLLAGPSGVGKSTLTYAGLHAGLAVLSEDTVHLQLRPRLRIWGFPGHLHLPTAAVRCFPELADLPTVRLANGKEKVAIDLRHRASTCLHADQAVLCLLQRHAAAPTIESLPATQMLRRMPWLRESGFAVFADTVRPAIEALAGRGAWQLTLSPDPTDALPLLMSLFQ